MKKLHAGVKFFTCKGSFATILPSEPFQDLDLWNPVLRETATIGSNSFSLTLAHCRKGKEHIVYGFNDEFGDTDESNETQNEKELDTQESMSPPHTTSSRK